MAMFLCSSLARLTISSSLRGVAVNSTSPSPLTLFHAFRPFLLQPKNLLPNGGHASANAHNVKQTRLAGTFTFSFGNEEEEKKEDEQEGQDKSMKATDKEQQDQPVSKDTNQTEPEEVCFPTVVFHGRFIRELITMGWD